MSYNGYTNYETWNVSLWIDNDQGTYNEIMDMAQKCYDDDPEDAVYNLEDRIKDYIEEENPLANQASMWSDLINAALSEVDWREIAENWIETIKENAE